MPNTKKKSKEVVSPPQDQPIAVSTDEDLDKDLPVIKMDDQDECEVFDPSADKLKSYMDGDGSEDEDFDDDELDDMDGI